METFAKLVPVELQNESGLVFYSGRAAFEGSPPIYLLGANPGAGGGLHTEELIKSETQKALRNPALKWSSYVDATWGRRRAGEDPMQKRLAHMFRNLGVDLKATPSSNLIFTRSRNVAEISADFGRLALLCWPFHQAVIDQLKPRVVLCMGDDAGSFVRGKLGARHLVDQYVEDNNRRWKSTAFAGSSGPVVVTVTHPSRAESWLGLFGHAAGRDKWSLPVPVVSRVVHGGGRSSPSRRKTDSRGGQLSRAARRAILLSGLRDIRQA